MDLRVQFWQVFAKPILRAWPWQAVLAGISNLERFMTFGVSMALPPP
jgi:hypothetical protein